MEALTTQLFLFPELLPGHPGNFLLIISAAPQKFNHGASKLRTDILWKLKTGHGIYWRVAWRLEVELPHAGLSCFAPRLGCVAIAGLDWEKPNSPVMCVDLGVDWEKPNSPVVE
ncbi:hypothetical protein Bca4012_063311 [Brassica carinata]